MKEINLKEVFAYADAKEKGYLGEEEYSKFFQEFYQGDMPVSKEDVQYLFMKHNKEKTGKVGQIQFIKEFLPIENILLAWSVNLL